MAGQPIYLDQRNPWERMLPQMLQLFMASKMQTKRLDAISQQAEEQRQHATGVRGQDLDVRMQEQGRMPLTDQWASKEVQGGVVNPVNGKVYGPKPQPKIGQMSLGGIPHSVIVDKAKGTITLKQLTTETTNTPTKMKDFELTQFGKLVPEQRGTASYKAKRLSWIREQKEASPYYATQLEGIERQIKANARREGTGLRKEFNQLPEIKQFAEYRLRYDVMAGALKEAKTSKNMVAVDQAIITTFNKMTDPGSVVRESEYLRTSHDLALWHRIKGKIEKWQKGGAGLTLDDRKALAKLGKQFYEASQGKYKERLNEYRSYVKEYGLNPDKYLKRPKWMGSVDYDYEYINGKLVPAS